MTSIFSRVLSIPVKHPFAFGVGLSCFKTSFSDLLVQKVVEKRKEIDWKRNAAFATFGFFYLGGVQYAIYVPFFGRLFPNAARYAAKPLREKIRDGPGTLTLIAQVFLDQCVHHPLMYFPAFYCTKELVTSEGRPDFGKALSTYYGNMTEDLKALWKVWVPCTALNFAFMPMWARIPWVAGVSLLWTCILSTMRGGDVGNSEELVGLQVTGATMNIFNEGLKEIFHSNPVDLDPKLCHICVSASGPDKVGWVAKVTRAVADGGGNVTHSNMLRLGHDFIIMMHVSVSPERHRELLQNLNNRNDLKPLAIKVSSLTRRQTGVSGKPVIGLRIHCVGEDRPGMLASISEKICEKGMSIENITTEIRMGKNGRRDFVVKADCTSTDNVLALGDSREALQQMIDDLTELKPKLALDVLDIRVHMDN